MYSFHPEIATQGIKCSSAPIMLSFLSLLRFKVARLQIPGHGWQLDTESVEVLGHLDLAAESRGLGEAEGEVEHVVLIIIWLLHLVVHSLVFDDDVAG